MADIPQGDFESSLSNINGVQKLSTVVSSPPEEYILKEGVVGSDYPTLQVPIVDLSLLTSACPQGEREVETLRRAFTSCGYIQAVNHGMEDSFLDEVHALTEEFFSLPIEEKMKCERPKDHMDGYGNDITFSEKETRNWNDRLYLVVKPESQRKNNVWPQNPTNFRKLLLEMTHKLEMVNEIVLRVMAKSLRVKDEDCFLKQFGENPTVLSRFNLHPPCSRPDLVLACKAHADGSGLTYLLQDKRVEGLQALKDGEWHKVPIIPRAILVNVGDQLEIMSNGIFKSPIHRVATNPHEARMTLAIFFAPDPTSEVEPVQELVDEEHPKVFNSIVEYTSIYYQSYQTNKRPIDLLRV